VFNLLEFLKEVQFGEEVAFGPWNKIIENQNKSIFKLLFTLAKKIILATTY
jgi:hypothetical protein